MQMRFRSGDAMLTTSDVESDKVTLRHYKQLIMSLPWWIIPMFVAIGVIVAYVITKQITPTYQTNTTVLVSKADLGQIYNYEAMMSGEKLVYTYVKSGTTVRLKYKY
jgi:capsular polysaccharide biosynthesis protein